MDTYLPISKAATITKRKPIELQEMIASGTIRAIKTPSNKILVNESDLIMALPKEERFKKYAHLAGNAILVSEASRKYNVSTPTITRWIQRGLITVIKKSIRRTYIDEAEIAYLAEIYNMDPGQGKRTVLKA